MDSDTKNLNSTLRKLALDRMTPEFKLNNEEFIRKDSRTNSSGVHFDDNDLSPRMESLLGIGQNPNVNCHGMIQRSSTRKISISHIMPKDINILGSGTFECVELR